MNEGKEAAEKAAEIEFAMPGECSDIEMWEAFNEDVRAGYVKAFVKCFTELYLPERQRAEAQGNLIEKLEADLTKSEEAVRVILDQFTLVMGALNEKVKTLGADSIDFSVLAKIAENPRFASKARELAQEALPSVPAPAPATKTQAT